MDVGSLETTFIDEAVYTDGTSEPATGLDVAKALAVEISARRVVQSATDPEDRSALVPGDETVTVAVEHSDDGDTWEEAASHEFTADDVATLTVTAPKAYVRVAWTLDGTNPQPVITARGRATGKTQDQIGDGGSQPWVGPFPVGWADFQPTYQTVLADAAPYVGKILVAALVIPTEDWNDTGDTVGINVYVGDPENATFNIDSLGNVNLKETVASTTDTQDNRVGHGSIVFAPGIAPGPTPMQNSILVGDGPLNKVFAYLAGGNNDGTTGGADLYLCFVTPVAP